MRYLISGGGTGGHIFPALAIANKIKKEDPEAEILFIGANNKMEMKRVPEAGYPIEGLTIYGISRDFSLQSIKKNLALPFVMLRAMRKAKKIIQKFNPNIAIGVGGFASGPALKMANLLRIPTLLQEQNSYPGVTNKMLAKHALRICVSYDGLNKYFPADMIVKTGNPIRAEILNLQHHDPKAYAFFNFTPEKRTVLVVGGSLGARSLNETLLTHLDDFRKADIQLLWQTGEQFYKANEHILKSEEDPLIRIVPFIKNMNDAYSVAHVIVSRAGAMAISELSVVGKPVILVPFPYAAEDHQTYNAKALSSKEAALFIADNKVKEALIPMLMNLVNDDLRCEQLRNNLRAFAQPNAIDEIYKEILNIIQ